MVNRSLYIFFNGFSYVNFSPKPLVSLGNNAFEVGRKALFSILENLGQFHRMTGLGWLKVAPVLHPSLFPCPLLWNHAPLPVRGRVCFPTFWAWAGHDLLWPKEWGSSDSVSILSLSLQRLGLFHPVFCSSVSSKGTALAGMLARCEGQVEDETCGEPRSSYASWQIWESPAKASRATSSTTADQGCRSESSQTRETTQRIDL